MALSGNLIRVAAIESAEDDDHRVFADEHVQIAAHEHHNGYDDQAKYEPNARGDIHGYSDTSQPPILDGGAGRSEPRIDTLVV